MVHPGRKALPFEQEIVQERHVAADRLTTHQFGCSQSSPSQLLLDILSPTLCLFLLDGEKVQAWDKCQEVPYLLPQLENPNQYWSAEERKQFFFLFLE